MSECNHVWHRTNGATLNDGSDEYRCSLCASHGKSYGLGGVESVFVVRDPSKIDNRRPRDYPREYANRKLDRDIMRRAKTGAPRDPDGLEFSLRNFIDRIENFPQPLTLDDFNQLETAREKLENLLNDLSQ